MTSGRRTFLPPTLIYLLLDNPALDGADLSSLQCLWYGAAPMSATKLAEAITRIGPVFGQLSGQSEARPRSGKPCWTTASAA